MTGSPNRLSLLFAEMKRRGVTRLIAVYAVVALGIVEAADIIGGRFQIPEGTIRAIIIIAIVGFPLALIFGWIYDITSKGIIKTKPITSSERASLAKLGWKPSWLTVILFLFLALITTAFFTVPRPNALGFKGQDWILIADLENNTSDESFDKALTHALTVTIEQSRHINIFPHTQVQEVLKRMQRETLEYIDVSTALEIAQREHIRAVLVPTISEVGSAYLLSARLLNPESGDIVRSMQVQAPAKEDILSALDELAMKIRKDLGESLQKIHLRTVRLEQATTSSLEALKLLSDASLTTNDPYYAQSIELLKEAVELDPEFALAHSNLASYYFWTNMRDEGEEHVAIALSLLDRLTEKERLWIQAAVEGYRGNRESSVIKWGTFLTKYPNTYAGWFRLAYNYMRLGQYEESISAFTRALEVYNDDEPSVLINLATCYSQLPDYENAVSYYLKAFELNPGYKQNAQLRHEFGFTYLEMGETAKAEEVFTMLLQETNKNLVANGNRSLALLRMYQGQYTTASELMHEAIILHKSVGYSLSEFRNRLYLCTIHKQMGNSVEYQKELDHCFRMLPETTSEPWWFTLLGNLLARDGDVERAEEMLSGMEERSIQGNESDLSSYNQLKGEIELRKGNFSEALEYLETAAALRSSNYTLESLANYYYERGNWEMAVSAYEEVLGDKHSLGWEGQECWIRAKLNIGRAFEASGNLQKAREAYNYILELWDQADADLPELIDIKERRERLSSAST